MQNRPVSNDAKELPSNIAKQKIKPSGDPAVDNLVTDGVINKLKTCCGQDIFRDHEMSLTLQNGTAVFSTTLNGKQVHITQNNIVLSRWTEFDVKAVYTAAFYQQPMPISKIHLTKASVDNKGEAIPSTWVKATEHEFKAFFDALPQAIRDAIAVRETRGQKIKVETLPNGATIITPDIVLPKANK